MRESITNTTFRFIIAAMAALLAVTASCSKEAPIADEEHRTPIIFAATLGDEDAPTKGLAPMTDQTLETFGVFTAYHPEGSNSSAADWTYMVNTPYRRNSLTGTFDTAPARYWPVAGTMTFFALAPYDRNILDGVDMQAIEQSRYPTIEWSPNEDPKQQVDICVAVNKNQPRQLEVPLEFHHATSQIYFAANCMELSEGEFMVIDTIILNSLIGRKNVTISAVPPYVEWEPDGTLPKTFSYELSRAKGHLNSIRLPLYGAEGPGLEMRGWEITKKPEGILYLVPQSFTSSSTNVEIIVKYSMYYQDVEHGGEPELLRKTVMEGALPPCEWKPDYRYRYVLSINDKTREVGVNVIADYASKLANFYAMTCSFPYAAVTKTDGDVFEIVASVGPAAIPAKHKEVDWEVDDETIARVEPHADAAGTGDDALQNRTAKITCLREGKTMIRAITRWAASYEEKCIATLELTVGPTGASFEPYGTAPHTSWPI